MNLSRCCYRGDADFSESTYEGSAVFEACDYQGYTYFNECLHRGFVSFSGSTYANYTNFYESIYCGKANLGGCVYKKYPDFSSAAYFGDVTVAGARFSEQAPSFAGCVFNPDRANDFTTADESEYSIKLVDGYPENARVLTVSELEHLANVGPEDKGFTRWVRGLNSPKEEAQPVAV